MQRTTPEREPYQLIFFSHLFLSITEWQALTELWHRDSAEPNLLRTNAYSNCFKRLWLWRLVCEWYWRSLVIGSSLLLSDLDLEVVDTSPTTRDDTSPQRASTAISFHRLIITHNFLPAQCPGQLHSFILDIHPVRVFVSMAPLVGAGALTEGRRAVAATGKWSRLSFYGTETKIVLLKPNREIIKSDNCPYVYRSGHATLCRRCNMNTLTHC